MKKCMLFLMLLGAWAAAPAQNHWVTAYYAGWAKWNATPVDVPQIDFTCATHWVFFTLGPTSSGTFDGSGSGIDTTRLRQFAVAAHGAGRKAIIGTGGWGSDYTGVVTNQSTSIAYLTGLMKTYGYDGVDIDWEPVASAQYANFATWVKALKAAMLAVNPQAVLTAAAMGTDQALINNQQYFDQINLMTYDMSGPWPGWVSWHNSAIYDGGNRFPSTNGLMPSIDGSVASYLSAGVPAAKLGFGIEFYGYIWNGVTGPMQSGFGTVQNTVPYAQIMDTYGGYQLIWDAGAQAAYYSTASQFVSFDAETTLVAKASYMKSKGLGGVILYEVAAAYRANLPAGFKDHLLQTVKSVFMGGGPPPSDSIPPAVTMTAPASNAVLSNSVSLKATATDNVGVAGLQFLVDGKPVGNEQTASPYTLTLNTWNYANGAHTVGAVARDWAGNTKTVSEPVTVANSGPPPVIPDMLVYGDALASPFTNTSWNATVDFANTSPVSAGSTRSAKVSYNAWGGFDMLSGTWSAEQPIDITVYDSLVFDVYSPVQISLTVGYYVGNSPGVTVSPNAWHTFAVPLPTTPFSRFYFQSGSASTATVYFDNIKFKAIPLITGTGAVAQAPGKFSLAQNYPNPFNPTTSIAYQLVNAGQARLTVYDILGRQVAVLADGVQGAGLHEVRFDASGLASGVYIYRLQSGAFVEQKKMILEK